MIELVNHCLLYAESSKNDQKRLYYEILKLVLDRDEF
jgi:hypothetical protein